MVRKTIPNNNFPEWSGKMSTITLTGSQRVSLLSLQKTAGLSERTQNRLSTGRNISNVTDGAVAFFRNRALNDRVTEFEKFRQDIDQSLSAVNTMLQGLDAIDSLLRQARGVLDASKSQTQQERSRSTTQFTTVLSQIYQLTEDTSYQGTNLLNNTSSEITVTFGIRTASRLTVGGVDLNNTANNVNGLFTNFIFSSRGNTILTNIFTGDGFTLIGSNNSNIAIVDNSIARIDNALTRARTVISSFSNDVSILQSRLEFTENYVDQLNQGAEGLVRADLNEEGANLVALQTSQQLGIQALSLAGQQQQAVLGLF